MTSSYTYGSGRKSGDTVMGQKKFIFVGKSEAAGYSPFSLFYFRRLSTGEQMGRDQRTSRHVTRNRKVKVLECVSNCGHAYRSSL